ncbi:cytokine receptor common subunit beta isoform X2 [Cheilinus undulatus]|uniref:cytokine receptor common subunit beta isoform X2 n=1 Tax=Cheilinus undulatus TaxID=241271 RepID=UPI001BD677E8|nr:cytokine receptor common subunit beta isoform X2 [Cheilinus undulatus]
MTSTKRMPLLWVALWSMLPPLALLSSLDTCVIHESSSFQHESLLLKSLHCHNDYKTHVHCRWREHSGRELELWFKTKNKNERCEPHGATDEDESGHRMVQCRYKTHAFAIGIKHTAFFLDKKTPCSPVQSRLLDLSQHLRTRTPVNVSTQEAGDEGQQLSWSSPYPSSSSLSENITYQLGYRMGTEDNWTTLNTTNTSITLGKQLLIPGHRYEARVRARASRGQWSDWSPVVTWKTEDDAGYSPSLHCVLNGEEEVMCSWEVSRKVDHLISYQLACRRGQTTLSEGCCVNRTVTTVLSGTALKFSCWLTVADPEHLLLELQPTRNAKIFKANKHIRPKPPQQVVVKDKGNSWTVEWTNPSLPSDLNLNYQVCYYRLEEKRCDVPVNVSGASMSWSILQSSLIPSQLYKVRVRSLVDPGEDFMYEGIPSEWTNPVDWTSHEATWSPHTLIYCSIGVLVAIVFLTLYCTIPACRRKVLLWVDSVPSPGKSKILSEFKSATHWTFVPSENTSFFKVQHSDSMSTCSSLPSLELTKDTEGTFLEQDDGSGTCDSPALTAETVQGSGLSSMSFSGPYIFCQNSDSNGNPEDFKSEEKEDTEETPSDDSVSPPPQTFTLFGDGYVDLPGRSISHSSQNLPSHSDAATSSQRLDSNAQDPECPDTSPWLKQTNIQVGHSEPSSHLQAPAYTSVTFTSWPQEVVLQASGYCHIPTAHVSS